MEDSYLVGEDVRVQEKAYLMDDEESNVTEPKPVRQPLSRPLRNRITLFVATILLAVLGLSVYNPTLVSSLRLPACLKSQPEPDAFVNESAHGLIFVKAAA